MSVVHIAVKSVSGNAKSAVNSSVKGLYHAMCVVHIAVKPPIMLFLWYIVK